MLNLFVILYMQVGALDRAVVQPGAGEALESTKAQSLEPCSQESIGGDKGP